MILHQCFKKHLIPEHYGISYPNLKRRTLCITLKMGDASRQKNNCSALNHRNIYEHIHHKRTPQKQINQSIDTFNCLENDELDNCISIEVTPLNATSINVTATNEKGCEEYFLFHINVEKEFNVFAPNIISTTNDNTFKLYSNSNMLIMENFVVYSRWGEKLYQEENVRITNMTGWDLMVNNSNVGSGVYVYQAQYQHPSQGLMTLVGDIMVVH